MLILFEPVSVPQVAHSKQVDQGVPQDVELLVAHLVLDPLPLELVQMDEYVLHKGIVLLDSKRTQSIEELDLLIEVDVEFRLPVESLFKDI